jgi:hypothetical protein
LPARGSSKNFIDRKAEFIYVPFAEVKTKAKELNAIPFDVPDAEFTHYGDECTFDYFVKKYKLDDPALKTMAVIVRGADTDRHDIASQASGLWAISAGLAFNNHDDQSVAEKRHVDLRRSLQLGEAFAKSKAYTKPYRTSFAGCLSQIPEAKIFFKKNSCLGKGAKRNNTG